MFNWEFTYYGAAACITLFILAFILNWVIKPNFRNKYRNIKVHIGKNSLQIAKEYSDMNRHKIDFLISKNNFWETQFKNNYIKVDSQDFNTSSLYSITDVLYKAMMSIRFKNNYIFISKLLIASNAILLNLSLIFGFYIGIIISCSYLGVSSLLEYLINLKKNNDIFNKLEWSLKKMAVSSSQYKKMLYTMKFRTFDKYISIFSELYISTFLIFKKWGVDE